MKTFKRCVAIGCIALGGFFLLSVASDIQLGFGLVLLALGLLSI